MMDSDFRIEFKGSIRNEKELRVKFNLKNDTTLAEVLAHAWNKYGISLGRYLVGEFAVWIFEPVGQKLTLIQDRVGGQPLYFTRQANQVFPAFNPNHLLSRTDFYFSKNLSWIVHFLTIGSQIPNEDNSYSHQTGYNEIRKVGPGVVLVFEAGELISSDVWHKWEPIEHNASSNDDWVGLYKEQLIKTISFFNSATKPPVVEVSGGLDSSSIACVLSADLSREQKKSYTGLSNYRWKDENQWIDLIEKEAGFHCLLSSTGPDRLDLSNKIILAAKGYPAYFQPEIGLPMLERIANDGFSDVLSGFGGDEVVTQHGDEYPLEAFYSRDYRTLWKTIKGHRAKRPVRFLKLLFTNSLVKLWPNTMKPILENTVFHSYLTLEARSRNDLRESIENYTNNVTHIKSMNDSAVFSLVRKPLLQARLEDHSLVGQYFGIKYGWPLLDHELISIYLSAPSNEKVSSAFEGRHLHRRAVREIVPDKILDVNTKRVGDIQLPVPRFRAIQQDVILSGLEVVDNLNHLLTEIVDISAVKKDIDNFKDQKRIEDDISVVEFWMRIQKLSALNHWCIYGR